jgi:small subunit ribosomal protein S8
MTNDLVSDMLTRVRNATLARHSFTRVQYSKLTLAILKVLAAEGLLVMLLNKDKLAQLELKYY